MKKTFTIDIYKNIKQPQSKRLLNTHMFREIAPNYDRICRIMSFDRDKRWKHFLIEHLPVLDVPNCLDLACGTGDLSFLLSEKYPDASIIGIDITWAMLDLAAQRCRASNIDFRFGDICDIPFPEKSFDIVTGGYALRNAPSLITAVREIHRILKPQGIAAFLDFSKPPNGLYRKFQHVSLKTWTGMWGYVFHRNPQVYNYIAESLRLFPNSAALKEIFNESGFKILLSQKFFFDTIEVTIIQKSHDHMSLNPQNL